MPASRRRLRSFARSLLAIAAVYALVGANSFALLAYGVWEGMAIMLGAGLVWSSAYYLLSRQVSQGRMVGLCVGLVAFKGFGAMFAMIVVLAGGICWNASIIPSLLFVTHMISLGLGIQTWRSMRAGA